MGLDCYEAVIEPERTAFNPLVGVLLRIFRVCIVEISPANAAWFGR